MSCQRLSWTWISVGFLRPVARWRETIRIEVREKNWKITEICTSNQAFRNPSKNEFFKPIFQRIKKESDSQLTCIPGTNWDRSNPNQNWKIYLCLGFLGALLLFVAWFLEICSQKMVQVKSWVNKWLARMMPVLCLFNVFLVQAQGLESLQIINVWTFSSILKLV